ncbi:MAG: GAF domain-containing protein, partial [Chloroflexota bacterium]|nr:GAF domain-containing protein [Chloroflexota bacterium]
MALVPLKGSEGNLGLLQLNDRQRGRFTLKQIEFYEGLAQAIGIALQRQQAEEALKLRGERRAIINHITSVISSTLDMGTIFRALEEEMPRLVQFDRLNIYLRQGDALQQAYTTNDLGGLLPSGIVTSAAQFPNIQRALEGQAVIRRDFQKEMNNPLDSVRIAAGLRSAILVPMSAAGRVLGVLSVSSKEVGKYSEADLEYLQPIADQVAVALAHARLFEQVEAGKQEWETIFDAMSDGVALLSPDLRILRANQALASLTGTTPQTLVGQRCCEVMHGSSEPLPECAGMQCLAEKRPCSLVRREPRLGNRWIHYLAAPVLDAAGTVVRLVHVARDITELRQRQDDLERLNRLSRTLASSLDLEAVLNRSLEEIADATAPTSTIAIALLDEWQSGVTFVAARGLRASDVQVQSVPLSALPPQLTSSLLGKREPYLVHDVSQLPLALKSLPAFADSQTAAVLPLATAERVIGVLVIADTQGLLPDEGRLEWLQTCANEIALAVENARLFSQTDAKLRRRVAELETINKISAAAHHHLTLSALLQETLPLAAEALGVERATVFLLEPGGLEATRIAAFHKGRDTASDIGGKVSPSSSPWLWTAVAKLETQVVENIPALLQGIPAERILSLGLRSLMAVPLVAEGRAVGTLHFGRTTRTGGFSREEINLAQNIAGYLALAIENTRLHEETEQERLRLESTLTSMGEGLVLVDRELKVAYCNRAAQELLDIESQRVLGQPVQFFQKAWMGRVIDPEELHRRWGQALAQSRERHQVEFELLTGPARRTIQAIL